MVTELLASQVQVLLKRCAAYKPLSIQEPRKTDVERSGEDNMEPLGGGETTTIRTGVE